MKYAIVAIGYNRPYSLLRLLRSLENAEYDGDVSLFISIDKSQIQNEVVKVISSFYWSHGNKKIIVRKKRMGLRDHVLSCGDLVLEYDALIMFEDDIVVSPQFFHYVNQTLSFYKNDERVAGISLYKHETHPGVFRPFIPYYNGYDVFFMQFAQSWGQCWTKQMWKQFKNWYNDNINMDLGKDDLLPSYIANWNNQSWLKYFMRYVVEKDLYFVYPYVSLSTNAADPGEHNVAGNNDFQVALEFGAKKFRFPKQKDEVKYDVFFERQNYCGSFETEGKVVLDLYGLRRNYLNADFVFSTKELPYKVEKSIQLKYRPMECNLLFMEHGDGINLYNLRKPAPKCKMDSKIVTRYDVRATSFKQMIILGLDELKDVILIRLRRLFGNKK